MPRPNAGTLFGAIIGAGSIAPYHLRAWSRTPGVEIVAAVNRTLEKARTVAQGFGIDDGRVYPDIRDLLRDERSLDFVDIVTAPDTHRRVVELAAASGVHILCQKPLATTYEDAAAMVVACRQAGVVLSVNENWRWRRWYREIQDLLRQGAIGSVRYARIAAHQNVTLSLPGGGLPALLTSQPYTAAMSRLIVLEWGIHLIDVLRMLFGEPRWIHAHMTRVSPLVAGEDRALMTLGFGELVASLDISWSSHAPQELPTLLEDVTIEGDQGTIALLPNTGNGDLLRLVRPLPDDRIPANLSRPWSPVVTESRAAHGGDFNAEYQASFDAAQLHFVECLRDGREPETSGEDNLRTFRVVAAAYESAAQNRVVAL